MYGLHTTHFFLNLWIQELIIELISPIREFRTTRTIEPLVRAWFQLILNQKSFFFKSNLQKILATNLG